MEERERVVAVTLGDGSVVHVAATQLGGDEDVAAIGGALSFAEVSRTVEGIARELAGCLDRVKPDKASIEFGLELAIEGGQLTALIVKGSAKGNLKIALGWERPKG